MNSYKKIDRVFQRRILSKFMVNGGVAKMLFKHFSSIAVLFSTLAHVIQCERCYVCNVTQDLRDCQQLTDCQNNFGCFSHTWVLDGQRHYKKGCSNLLPTPCGVTTLLFCTLEFATICCSGDQCNSVDPVAAWRPQKPENVRLTTISSSSVTVDWTIQCNAMYEYQVDYSRPGEQLQTLSNIDGTMIHIPGLHPGYYQFSIRSIYAGRYSAVTTIHRRVPFANETGHGLCATMRNITMEEANSSNLQACLIDQQRCFTVLNYYTNGGQAYVTSGCVAAEACNLIANVDQFGYRCKPGVANAFCNFCCEGNGCNSNKALISANLVCNGIDYADRINCGWEGIDHQTCSSRGCCYNATNSPRYDKWCFHKRYDPSSTTTPALTTTSSPEIYIGGVVYWVVIVIVLAIFVLILIIVFIVYCVVAKKRRKQRGFYDVDAVYAIPNRDRRRTVSTMSSITTGNPLVSVQEAA